MMKPFMSIAGLILDYPTQPHEKTARVTPTRDVFTVAHMGVPQMNAENWSLEIGGLVDTPRTLDFAALKALPKRVIESVHKCAGDPLDATLPTRQVTNVQWAGADLRDVLARAGVRDSARYVWASGADHGVLGDGGHTVAIAEYQKDIPLTRIAEGNVLIAYEMNGEALGVAHGYPARLIVPGYYGTNSVKWLTRLELAEARAASVFTTFFYNDPAPMNGDPEARRPVWRLAAESLITAPAAQAVLRVGIAVEIWGWAWSGGELRGVDISSDGGMNWSAALLEDADASRRHAWRRFSYSWTPANPGNYEFVSRAADGDGAQPMNGARNAVHRVGITVR